MATRKQQPQAIEVATPIQVGDVAPELPPPAVTTNTANSAKEAMEKQPGYHGNFPEDDQKVFDTATEEFNEHVKSLVRLFFEHETAELQQRIVDLELLTADLLSRLHHGNQQIDIPQQTVEAPSYTSEFPEYVQEHQGGQGAPWYSGD